MSFINDYNKCVVDCACQWSRDFAKIYVTGGDEPLNDEQIGMLYTKMNKRFESWTGMTLEDYANAPHS